jgi:hypothetical protein
VPAETVGLIERMATENPTWGYQRIQGELRKIGYRISASTIRRTLKSFSIPPAPKRPGTSSIATDADLTAAVSWNHRVRRIRCQTSPVIVFGADRFSEG